MSLILTILCGLAHAEPAETEALPTVNPSEEPKSDTETTNAQPAEKAQPTVKPEPAKGSLIKIEVKLTNGLNVDGEIERKVAISWQKGQPLQIWAEGEWLELKGDTIDSIITTNTKAPQAGQQSGATQVTPVVVQIKEEPLPESAEGFQYPNYMASRYLYSPSALSVPQGNGYVSQKMIFFTSAAYGVTDNLTILGGTITFFPPAISILGAKYSFEVADDVRIGIGGETFMSAFAESNDPFVANIGFANITYGNEDKNLTLAGGVGEMFDNLIYPITISGSLRMSDAMALLTETWIVLDSTGNPVLAVPSVACRYMSKPKSKKGSNGYGGGQFVDFGFFGFFSLDSSVAGTDAWLAPFPWVDFGATF